MTVLPIGDTTGTDSGSFHAALPSGWHPGDLAVLFVTTRPSSTPTNWKLAGASQTVGTLKIWAYYRILDSSSGSGPTLNVTSSCFWRLVVIRGVNNNRPYARGTSGHVADGTSAAVDLDAEVLHPYSGDGQLLFLAAFRNATRFSAWSSIEPTPLGLEYADALTNSPGTIGTRPNSNESSALVLAFRQAPAPDAPAWASPPDGTTLDSSQSQTLRWTTDAGVALSGTEIRWSSDSGATWDGATLTYNAHAYTIDPAGVSALPDDDYQFQVRIYDQNGNVSDWSPSLHITLVPQPDEPTIEYPANGGTVAGTDHVDWSFAGQEQVQVRRIGDDNGNPDTGTIYFDSGTVVDPAARTYPLTFPVNNRAEHIEVRTYKDGLWSDWADVLVEVSFTPPPATQLTIEEGDDGGSIRIDAATAAPSGGQPTPTTLDLSYSTDAGATATVFATGLAPTGTYSYDVPQSGLDYAFQAVVHADNGTTTTGDWIARGTLTVDEVT